MRTLSIDIETYSDVDIKSGGVYKYVASPNFEILLFAYAFDNEPVQIIDMTQDEKIPIEVIEALTDETIEKTAFTASFERVCLSKELRLRNRITDMLCPSQWSCTMVNASMLGLPLSLDKVSMVLKSEVKFAGKALIRYFTMPCKPTKANGLRTRNLPEHDPIKWQQFKDYCVQDVVAERSIKQRIKFFTIPPEEVRLYSLDQRINDRGIMLDPQLIKHAIKIAADYKERLIEEATNITGLSNPNSVKQLTQWITTEDDTLEVKDLKKDSIPALLKETDSKIVERVLELRQEMSKTSIRKYTSMSKTIGTDLRVRGLLQIYGANRTGRWAGRLIQMQNLARIKCKDIDLARQLVLANDADTLELTYGIPDGLSQLIRTAFVAAPGHRLIVADFSSIELIVAAWLAREQWVIDEFNGSRKIYEATAARMLKIPVETIDKDSQDRQKGKIASLACQYGGGVGALIKMGALTMGLVEAELPDIITMWRAANPNIKSYWRLVQDSAIQAVKEGVTTTIYPGIRFFTNKGFLFVELPSKRQLAYVRPKITQGKFGDELSYEGMDQTTKQWKRQKTYGGKLFENLCQAIARDCLADAMTRIDAAGYTIVGHVHDEIIIEAPDGFGSLEDVIERMSTPIPWAQGLPLSAAGFENNYYKK